MEAFDKDLSEVVINSFEKFNMELFNVVKDASSNQIFSSYSVSSVLSMILPGACGNTAMQLRKSFGLQDDQDHSPLQSCFRKIFCLSNLI